MDEEYDWSLLENAVEYQFTGWQPEPGSLVVGQVAYVSEGEGNWGPYPMLAVITRDGEGVMIHGFHTVLRNELERQDPQTGDRIAVKYMGTKPSKKEGQDPTHIYNVVVDHSRTVVAAAQLASGETPALPSGDMNETATEMTEPEQEPLGWEPTGTTDADGAGVESPLVEVPPPAPEPISRASKPQRDAIDTLRAKQGLIPINWATANVSMERAAAHIRELQGQG